MKEIVKEILSLNFLLYFTFFLFIVSQSFHFAQSKTNYITSQKSDHTFTIARESHVSNIYVSEEDYPGVIRVADILKSDIQKVTDKEPQLVVINSESFLKEKEIILIGTIGNNRLIDNLVSENKIDVNDIAGKWESFLIQVVENPFPNVAKALVIAGSDKRGTIFGMFDLSEKIGVSPWYWWADVPVKKKENIYVLPGVYSSGEPKVKYRGIFINDEAPALSGWAKEKFGTELFNHYFYDHVFELILRLKGNFLWPAMWGRAFYDDDPLNPKLADEYGIVISTSHHEPMMRAHVEWQRYGSGPWNYEKNEKTLKDFWRNGIERMNDYESIVTLAMRGDGDEAMSEEANIGLLEKILNDQREIIKDVTKKNIENIPQVWALYKEVQEYYDNGMRVPDDVTILLCDDNWGNIRKLPGLNDKPRKGGYGIYYHYDFVGGPRNYKWLNTTQIERVWEQMNLAYTYGADRIWIVNVGDIKPMEFPISFFLDYAWNPEKFSAENLPEYYINWAEKQFGSEYSNVIAEILSAYTKYNSRRKPEMLSAETYSLINYREAESVVSDYNKLLTKSQMIFESIPDEYKSAYYQLVHHPVEACANLNELYFTVAKNHLYAKQGRVETNNLADKVCELFDKDSVITYYYNNILADGKWKHMMDQTHIGYTSWQQPDFNIMPDVMKIENQIEPQMGVYVEGSGEWFPDSKSDLTLPEFDKFSEQEYYIEIFNQGKTPFNFSLTTGAEWIKFSKSKGTINTEERVFVDVDWDNAPAGKNIVQIKINGSEGSSVVINAIIINPSDSKNDIAGFVESNGVVSIEAVNYSRKVETNEITWQVIQNLGRTFSAITPVPVTTGRITPDENSPRLEYDIHLFSKGNLKVTAYFSPTLNFSENGLQYAISFDNESPQVIDIHKDNKIPDWKYPQWWNEGVGNNIIASTTTHEITADGRHTLKFRMVDPGIVLQKIVIDTGGLKPSYLGPPESVNIKHKN